MIGHYHPVEYNRLHFVAPFVVRPHSAIIYQRNRETKTQHRCSIVAARVVVHLLWAHSC